MAIDEAGQPLLEAVLPAVGFVDVDAPQPGQVVERAGSLPRTVQRDEVVEDRVDALGKESVAEGPRDSGRDVLEQQQVGRREGAARGTHVEQRCELPIEASLSVVHPQRSLTVSHDSIDRRTLRDQRRAVVEMQAGEVARDATLAHRLNPNLTDRFGQDLAEPLWRDGRERGP